MSELFESYHSLHAYPLSQKIMISTNSPPPLSKIKKKINKNVKLSCLIQPRSCKSYLDIYFILFHNIGNTSTFKEEGEKIFKVRMLFLS